MELGSLSLHDRRWHRRHTWRHPKAKGDARAVDTSSGSHHPTHVLHLFHSTTSTPIPRCHSTAHLTPGEALPGSEPARRLHETFPCVVPVRGVKRASIWFSMLQGGGHNSGGHAPAALYQHAYSPITCEGDGRHAACMLITNHVRATASFHR